MHVQLESSARRAMSALALVAALAVGACGEDGDDGGDGKASAAASTAQGATGPAPGSPPPASANGASAGGGTAEEQVEGVVMGIQQAIFEGHPGVACAQLTQKARAELVRTAAFGPRNASCTTTVRTIAKNAAGLPQEATKVVSVKVSGNRATARVSDNGRPPQRMLLVKAQGRWKIDRLIDPRAKPD